MKMFSQGFKKRGILIFTFINKLDRDGREPLELLRRARRSLFPKSSPTQMNWPIGMLKGLEVPL